MPVPVEPPEPAGQLSLAEQSVLGIVAEGRLHGFGVARLLAGDGEIGRIYGVARPAVYRAIERLLDAGLVEALGVEPGERGPRRTPLRITVAGQAILDAWLRRPVRHVRDIRTEFLVKMVLIDRAGLDPSPLVAAQIEMIRPVVERLAERQATARGSDRAVLLWRWRTAQAALEFLNDLLADRSPSRFGQEAGSAGG